MTNYSDEGVNYKVLRDINRWLYIVKGMQCPTSRAEADTASSTYN